MNQYSMTRIKHDWRAGAGPHIASRDESISRHFLMKPISIGHSYPVMRMQNEMQSTITSLNQTSDNDFVGLK